MPEFLAVDVFFESAEDVCDGIADEGKLGFETGGDRDEDGFEGAEFVGEVVVSVAGVGLLAELAFEVVHKEGLCVGIGGAVGVEDEDAVGLNQHAQVQEVN